MSAAECRMHVSRYENLSAMHMRFLGQPFDAQPNLTDFLYASTTGSTGELRIAVAWAKRSGLGRAWDLLEDFRGRGGRVLLVVGVSEGGATREGLELAQQIADESYVFHDPQRTFHPKVYYTKDAAHGSRSLRVGSSNLTAGGLGWNYEASLWVDFDPGEQSDLTDGVEEWFDTLIADRTTCKPLTDQLIADIENSTDIRLGSEQRTRRTRTASDAPEDTDSQTSASINSIFAALGNALRKLPGLSSRIPALPGSAGSASTSGAHSGTSSPGAGPTGGTARPEPPTTGVRRRWMRMMDQTAAQQRTNPDTRLTAVLRLNKAGLPIDHQRYFREDLFGDLPWAVSPRTAGQEEVHIDFDVWIDGSDHGVHELRVTHQPSRDAKQHNVTTVLHWGDLNTILRETSYIDYIVTIERSTTDQFSLIISKKQRGEAII